MSGDVVARAKSSLAGVTQGPWSWTVPRYGVPELMGRAGDPETYEYDTEVLEASHSGECGCRSACELELSVSDTDRAFIAAARSLVPELVAEVEELRAAGPWTQHVERIRAMKQQRDGECICDGNPSTTNGPEEDCPWHGREYSYWVERSAEVEKLRGGLDEMRAAMAGMRHTTMCSTFLDGAPESECDCARSGVLAWIDHIQNGADS